MVSCAGEIKYFGTTETNCSNLQITVDQTFPNSKNIIIKTNNPLNRSFAIVKPGLVIVFDKTLNLQHQFPDWEIIYVTDNHITLPEEKINSFVQANFSHWFKNLSKNKFGVGILSIDDKNVIIDRPNQQIIEALENHKINVHVVEFRHRSLWALDVHSCTADLHRENNKE